MTIRVAAIGGHHEHEERDDEARRHRDRVDERPERFTHFLRHDSFLPALCGALSCALIASVVLLASVLLLRGARLRLCDDLYRLVVGAHLMRFQIPVTREMIGNLVNVDALGCHAANDMADLTGHLGELPLVVPFGLASGKEPLASETASLAQIHKRLSNRSRRRCVNDHRDNPPKHRRDLPRPAFGGRSDDEIDRPESNDPVKREKMRLRMS
jgi:hypothetical protein